MEQDDKKYLKELAKKVLSAIKNKGISTPFNARKKVALYNTNSGGWGVQLGIFRGYKCSFEIWIDQFTASDERKIYYCIFANQTEGFNQLIKLAEPLFGKHVTILLSDWSNVSDVARLKKELAKKSFGKPVYEKYPENNEFLYGVYKYDRPSLKQNKAVELVEEVVNFVLKINTVLSTERIKKEAQTLQGSENRNVTKSHLQRERKGRLVLLRKRLDNYVCNICGFDYREKYGTLGDNFAEAHHIIPLSKNKKQRMTSVDDLVTVCASCHRMLHRMNGEIGDIAKLKKIVNKKK